MRVDWGVWRMVGAAVSDVNKKRAVMSATIQSVVKQWDSTRVIARSRSKEVSYIRTSMGVYETRSCTTRGWEA
jgi:hypothetical protein